MELQLGLIAVAIVLGLIAIWLVFYFIPVGLWFSALVSGVKISLLQLILMEVGEFEIISYLDLF